MTKKSFFLSFFLASIAFTITVSPLKINGRQASFFSLDPDAMYVGNVLSYFKDQKIFYIDHPGTPAIILLSFAIVPLKIYAHLTSHQQFIYWVIEHPDILYFYLRIAQGVVASSALFIYLSVIYKVTKSLSAQVVAWAAIFSFSFFPYLFSIISGEATNFLIISIWLIFLTFLVQTNQPKYTVILSFISGLALANRLTNLFIVLTSLGLIVVVPKISVVKKLKVFFQCLFVAVISFFIGTWPIRHRYGDLFAWIKRLAVTSKIHGGGNITFFEPSTYGQSALSLISREFYPSLLLGLFIILLLYQILVKKRRIHSFVLFILTILTLGTLVFAKYPLTHYQLSHYLIFIYLISILLSQYYRHLILPISFFLLFIVVPKTIESYNKEIGMLINDSLTLNRFVSQHPPQVGTVWEWGLTRDFALLWGRDWSTGSYDQEFNHVKTNLYALQKGFLQASVNRYKTQNLFDLCWDHLYIQNQSLVIFLDIYPNKKLSVYSIPDTKHSLITSSHCLTPL